MTDTNTTNKPDQTVEAFMQFGADEQLALLWFIYEEVKGSITPSASDNETGFAIAQASVDQLAEMSQEQQLQAQRDIINGSNDGIAHDYANFNSSNRIAFWYLLGQEMEKGRIVNVPSDYKLPSEAQGFMDSFKGYDFEGQLTAIRNVVSMMGSSPKPGAVA